MQKSIGLASSALMSRLRIHARDKINRFYICKTHISSASTHPAAPLKPPSSAPPPRLHNVAPIRLKTTIRLAGPSSQSATAIPDPRCASVPCAHIHDQVPPLCPGSCVAAMALECVFLVAEEGARMAEGGVGADGEGGRDL